MTVHQVASTPALGMIVRQARLSQGYTQVEAARRIGVSQRWISELENGKPKEFNAEFLSRLHTLGVRFLVSVDGELDG